MTTPPLHVLACVANSLGKITPSYRVGIERWQPYLAEQNIQLTYLPYTSQHLKTIKYRSGKYLHKIVSVIATEISYRQQVKRLNFSQFDVAIVLREATLIGPPWLERSLVRVGLPYVYHIDDPIFLPTKSSFTPVLSVARYPSKIAEIVQHSQHVLAVNHTIKRYVNLLNPQCTVIPLGMNVETTPCKQSYVLNRPPVIGWIGSFSTCGYLWEIQPTLAQIQREFGCRIRAIGATSDFHLEDVHLDIIPWDGDTEDAMIREFDIGVNPTKIDPWAMGKGSTKTLQYMVNGVPCIASPTGSNIEIVDHGVNGLLARTSDEWIASLRSLLNDQQLRERFGHAGRQTIEQDFDSRQHALIIGDILRSVAKARVCAV